ncbi:MAG: histidine triad nucleotide-binding protein [Planctomycetes bacterium]|nr:histidine triad nucleotide-binding protein [Planctomycetota bacterium]
MANCVFCRIVAGEIPSTKVFENDEVLAFRDIAPQAPVHVLVVPRKHVDSVQGMEEAGVAAALLRGVAAVAEKEGLKSFRTIMNTGAESGQTVFHFHAHVLGGRKMKAMG